MKLKSTLLLMLLLILAIIFIPNKDTTVESPDVEAFNYLSENNMDEPVSDNIYLKDSSLDEEFDYLENTTYETEEGKLIIKNTDDILVLVNKKRNLPSDYIPEDLVIPSVRFSFEDDIPKRYLRKEAAEALEKLFKEAKKDNIILYGVSGYRSYNRQKTLFDNKANQVGTDKANSLVAFPGQSEHQTGLAIDVSSQSVNFTLEADFGQAIEGKWLKDNAHKSGFIIRYEKDTTDITGYSYEPWHIRYVGEDAAREIYKESITLEEFLGAINN